MHVGVLLNFTSSIGRVSLKENPTLPKIFTPLGKSISNIALYFDPINVILKKTYMGVI